MTVSALISAVFLVLLIFSFLSSFDIIMYLPKRMKSIMFLYYNAIRDFHKMERINMHKITISLIGLLAAAMAATRFNHFGTAFSLPDASYAVFFLGGLYLAKTARLSLIAFMVLVIEAGLIDWDAAAVQGINDWFITPAYWFLIPTYASLWLAGSWYALRNSPDNNNTAGWISGLGATVFAASSFAFLFSNATFFFFSGRYADMSLIEYSSRIAQYYVPYVSVALLYIAAAVAIQMAIDIIGRQKALPTEHRHENFQD